MIYIPKEVLAECRAFDCGGIIKHYPGTEEPQFLATPSFTAAVIDGDEVVCFGRNVIGRSVSETTAEGYKEVSA